MKNKYAASLATVVRPIKAIIEKKPEINYEVLAAKAEAAKRRQQVADAIATLEPIIGDSGRINFPDFFEAVNSILKISDPENLKRFVKNLKDGYLPWFLYRFYYNHSRALKTVIHPMEFDLYRADQTYGIQEFKKLFTPSGWKALVKIPVKKQFELGHMFMGGQDLENLVKCLHIGTDPIALRYLGGSLFSPVISTVFSLAKVDRTKSVNLETKLMFLKQFGSDQGELQAACSDLVDHLSMWKSLSIIRYKYPEIVKDLGVPLSGNWSQRRFMQEHARLSQMQRDCDRDRTIQIERKERWKRKPFFNINKFPELKGGTIDVKGLSLKVKLINSSTELYDEGTKMHHCIFNYKPEMYKRRYFALSITDEVNKNNCCTIAFTVANTVKTELSRLMLDGKQFEVVPGDGFYLRFNQVRGLRNHTAFTFRQEDLVNAVLDLLHKSGFKDYITGLSVKPLSSLKRHEHTLPSFIESNVSTRHDLKMRMLGHPSIMGDGYIDMPPTYITEGFPIPFPNQGSSILEMLKRMHSTTRNIFTLTEESTADKPDFVLDSLHGLWHPLLTADGTMSKPDQHAITVELGKVFKSTQPKEKPFLTSKFLKNVALGR